jgi:diaminopimelate epimerase
MPGTLAFAKYQGTGNDFIVVDGRAGLPTLDWPATARFLCDRHYGVGADGLLIVTRGQAAPWRMEVINKDGSTAEMCGNGIRCVARFLHDREEVGFGPFDVETGAGTLQPEVLPSFQVRVNMGKPVLERSRIPMAGPNTAQVVEEPVGVGAGTVLVTAVSMGNPHAVIFVRDVDQVPLADWGPRLEEHPVFLEGANIEFAEVVSPKLARMRVWERGSGLTLACGTGACATLVAGVLTGRLDREATIQLPGGPLLIVWDDKDHIWLTGPADPVFEGRVRLPAERLPSPGADHHHPDP